MAIGPSQFPKLYFLGPILPPLIRGIMKARTGKCVYYTYKRNTFLVSPYPYLLFGIKISLVQSTD